MTPRQMGEVFEFLLKHREASSNPIYRSRFPTDKNSISEQQVVQILESSFASDQYRFFEDFLAGQGFVLKYYDSTQIGARGEGLHFVLARAADACRAPLYANKYWFDNAFNYGQKKETKDKKIVWGIQLWLIMQYLLYTRHSRTAFQISLFGQTTISEAEFVVHTVDYIEKLRKKGRPEGDNGVVWDILTKADRKEVEGRIHKFLDLMCTAKMLMPIKGETSAVYRQTLLAAVEMSLTAQSSIDCLVPPKSIEEKMPVVTDVLNGYVALEEGENVSD